MFKSKPKFENQNSKEGVEVSNPVNLGSKSQKNSIKERVRPFMVRFRSTKFYAVTSKILGSKYVFWMLLILTIGSILYPIAPQLCFQAGICGRADKETQDLIEDYKKTLAEGNGLSTEYNKDKLLEKILEETDTDHNWVIVPEIGIKTKIVEGENEDALSFGSWHRPGTSTPPNGGNTVLTGHRFQYMPPNNMTFYNLDKLEEGDIVFVLWEGMIYEYLVDKTFEVLPEDVEIEGYTEDPTLTLYTCTPLWTATHRLVVQGKLVDSYKL